jgi:hypothetical protein
MDIVQVTAVIGAAASLLCTLVVGALTYFMKKTLANLENADKQNADHIAKVEDKLNELQVNLPLVFETREDSIRVMNRIEDKLNRLTYRLLDKEG